MKKTAIVLALALVVTSALMAGSYLEFGKVRADVSSEVNRDNSVVVQGVAQVLVKPDLARVQLGVETSNRDSKLAQEENRKLMNAVIDALVKAGIDKEDIATTNYNIYQTYDDNYKNDNSQRIFRVSNNVVITTKDIDRVGSIIDTATAAGANNVGNISFDTSKRQAYYNQALKAAMQNAKGKADAIVSTFGKTVSTPLRVSEVSYGGSAPVYAENLKMATSADQATSIQAGDLTISATLTVEYGY